MNRHIFLIICFILCSANPVLAYWIWTPKSGKWVNPKTAVTATPKGQLDSALSLFLAKRYPEARKEFSKLIKAYPKSAEAAEAQYYLARVEEESGDLYKAYQSYQKLIEKYPFSQRIQECIEKEYSIGEAFMDGKKRKAMGLTMPVENPAVEIFSKVVENSNYGPLADKAQYKLGLALKELNRYYEAEEAFAKLIKNYPQSEWAAAAKFQLAACRSALSKGPDYDQGATKDAERKFEEFMALHPGTNLTGDAEKNIRSLQDKQACSDYNAGKFYEKQKDYNSAKIYYNEVVNSYPQTVWAAKSLERLQVLERMKK